MGLLRFYQCECGESDERITAIDDVIHCEKCGSVMQRMITMPTIMLDGTDDGFPGAYSKWATVREKRAKDQVKKSYARR